MLPAPDTQIYLTKDTGFSPNAELANRMLVKAAEGFFGRIKVEASTPSIRRSATAARCSPLSKNTSTGITTSVSNGRLVGWARYNTGKAEEWLYDHLQKTSAAPTHDYMKIHQTFFTSALSAQQDNR